MKIRGIEIAIGAYGQNTMSAVRLGVIPLDIDVPAELTKTDWTPINIEVTVLTSTGKSSTSFRLYSMEQDPNFRVDQNMIAAAVAELAKRINAQRVQLYSLPEAFGEEAPRG